MCQDFFDILYDGHNLRDHRDFPKYFKITDITCIYINLLRIDVPYIVYLFITFFFLGATKRLYTAGMRIQQKNRNEEKNLFIFWLGKFKIRSYKPSF